MSRLGRRVASRILLAAARLLPRRLSPWARAMERELAEIADDRAALAFASGCLRAVLGLAFVTASSTLGVPTMKGISARPRLLGLLCGAGAVAMGVAYMVAAEAPARYLAVNLAALMLGAAAWLALGRAAAARLAGAGPLILALAAALLLTALFGIAVEGASRWVSVGPLSLQVSLIVVPVMLVLYARQPDEMGTAAMVAAALALALQPDRAMAGVLLAGLLALLLAKPARLPVVAVAAAAPAFGWALLVPDRLPASPYVDRILYTAFDHHPLAGAAVAIGAAALILPAMVGASREASERPALLAFGACWLGMVAAALLGNYPTPLVGYGGSAVLGYLLSAALLPSRALQRGAGAMPGSLSADGRSTDQTISELRMPHPA